MGSPPSLYGADQPIRITLSGESCFIRLVGTVGTLLTVTVTELEL